MAKIRGEEVPNLNINLPPGYIEVNTKLIF